MKWSEFVKHVNAKGKFELAALWHRTIFYGERNGPNYHDNNSLLLRAARGVIFLRAHELFQSDMANNRWKRGSSFCRYVEDILGISMVLPKELDFTMRFARLAIEHPFACLVELPFHQDKKNAICNDMDKFEQLVKAPPPGPRIVKLRLFPRKNSSPSSSSSSSSTESNT
jgi:hypothetical protein